MSQESLDKFDIDINHNVPDTLIKRMEFQRGNAKLDLTLCSLTKIPTDAMIAHFGMPANLDLDLSHNYIRSVSAHFVPKMKTLTKLDLSKNELRRLPDNFGELRSLVYLDLHQNKLETLPLSMGNMHRLTFLSVVDNPFRTPLGDLIGKMGTDISGLAMAELIVTLMQEVAKTADVSTTHSSKFPIDSRRSSKVHYRRRSSTMQDAEVSSTSSEDAEVGYRRQRRGSKTSNKPPALKTFLLGLGRFVLVLAVFCIFVPIYVAYFAETSYMDSIARTYPTFDMIWTDYNYKRVHELALPVANLLPKNNAWVLRGPPMDSGVSSGVLGWFSGIWSFFANSFRAMLRVGTNS